MTLKTRGRCITLSFNMDITYIVAVILHNVHPAYPVHKLSMHPHAFPLQAKAKRCQEFALWRGEGTIDAAQFGGSRADKRKSKRRFRYRDGLVHCRIEHL